MINVTNIRKSLSLHTGDSAFTTDRLRNIYLIGNVLVDDIIALSSSTSPGLIPCMLNVLN